MQEAAEKTEKMAGDVGDVEPGPCRPRHRPPSCWPKRTLSVDEVAGSGKRGQVLKADVVGRIHGAQPGAGADRSGRRRARLRATPMARARNA